MKHYILKYFRSDSGVAATEFAIVSPALVILLIGAIDAGLYINEKMKVEGAARTSVEYILNHEGEDYVMEDIMSLYFAPTDETEGEDMSWQDDVTVETGYVCECAGQEEIACTGVCSGDGDYRRRYVEASVSKYHTTVFPYPGLPATVVINGYARIQKD